MLQGLSLVAASGGYSLVAVYRLLIEVASLVAEMGSRAGAVAVAPRLWNTCSVVVAHRFILLHSMWDLPESGIKPVSPCIGRQILNHWTTREVPIPVLQMRKLRHREKKSLVKILTAGI